LRTPARVSSTTSAGGRLPVAAKPPSPPAAPKPVELRAQRDLELGDVRVAARCAARAAGIADHMRKCTPDSASKEVGLHLELSRECDVLGHRLTGTPDDATRACLATELGPQPTRVERASEWSVDYPLTSPAFISSPKGDVQVLTSHVSGENMSWRRLPRADWWALCPGDGGTALVPAAVGKNGTIWSIPAARCPHRPFAVIGGLQLLRPMPEPGRPVDTVLATVKTSARAMTERDQVTLVLGDRKYRLHVPEDPQSDRKTPDLYLHRGHAVQVLLTANMNYRVVWAGDLDDDGQLDLVLQTFMARSSSWRVDLFVSRDAGDRLVRTAATLQLEGD